MTLPDNLRDYTRATVGPTTWCNALETVLARRAPDAWVDMYSRGDTVGRTAAILRDVPTGEEKPRGITTADVWSALPRVARRALVECTGTTWEAPAPWTLDRVQVTPWSLLPADIREALHGVTTCQEMV